MALKQVVVTKYAQSINKWNWILKMNNVNLVLSVIFPGTLDIGFVSEFGGDEQEKWGKIKFTK